jgi:AcrR family transcriptional regulator
VTERPTRSNGRETMSRILEHARRELDEFGPVKFNIMRVIEESGVSKSSVYHHFGGSFLQLRYSD